MKLIIGLGNPGREYEKTRHNAGFMIVENLQQNIGFEPFHFEKKFKADVSIGNVEGEKIVIAKPQTFMNLSGEAAQIIIQFYKIPLQNCLVVYDDLDLAFGQIRIRKQGSAGTHNGMKSIIASFGSEDFPRLRFGIESRGKADGPEKSPPAFAASQETSSFVLSTFSKDEQKELGSAIKKAVQAVKIWLMEGIDQSMNRFNA